MTTRMITRMIMTTTTIKQHTRKNLMGVMV